MKSFKSGVYEITLFDSKFTESGGEEVPPYFVIEDTECVGGEGSVSIPLSDFQILLMGLLNIKIQ